MSFETIWATARDLTLERSSEAQSCIYAKQFEGWAGELLAKVAAQRDLVTINQCKVLLQDKWHEWRAVAPKDHRTRTTPKGHRCLFHVYEDAYLKLRAAELALTPPLLFLPEPPPKPRRQPKATPVLYLGEGTEATDG